MHLRKVLGFFMGESHEWFNKLGDIGAIASDYAQRALCRFHFTMRVIGQKSVEVSLDLLDPNGICGVKKA